MSTRKTAPCPECCPKRDASDRGGAIFEISWDWNAAPLASGGYPEVWRCNNCGHTMPRRARPVARDLADAEFDGLTDAARAVLTPSQISTIEAIFRKIEARQSHGNPDRYEWKARTIKVGGPCVFVTTEFGMKGDEGTAAAAFCRDYRLFMIGAKGGVSLLNAKRPEGKRDHPKVTGLFDACTALV